MLQNYGWISWVLVFGVFYIFLIMPEQRKQKKLKSMLSGIKEGDRILTRGGILGRIVSMGEDRVIIESGPERTRLEMTKTAIYTVLDEEGNPVSAAKKEENK